MLPWQHRRATRVVAATGKLGVALCGLLRFLSGEGVPRGGERSILALFPGSETHKFASGWEAIDALERGGSMLAALSATAALAWLAIIFGDDDSSILESDHRFILVEDATAIRSVKLHSKDAKVAKMSGKSVQKATKQNLEFARTTGSATWPSEKNPLKDFDADFLGPDAGFPTSTASAEWAFTKQPLLGFDEGFKDSWKGWQVLGNAANALARLCSGSDVMCSTLMEDVEQGPENNVYANLPPTYPFVETQLLPGTDDYDNWKNGGAEPENNVFNNGYVFPDY